MRYPLIWAVGLLLASGDWALYRARVIQPQCQLDGQQLICTACVIDMQALKGDRVQYTLRATPAGVPTECSWYAGSDVPLLSIGDTVTLNAKFARLSDSYPYQTTAYHAGHGVYLRITAAQVLAIQPAEGFSLTRMLQQYRTYISTRIHRTLPESQANLLLAMLFGEKRNLSAETSDALYQTGIGHIMAVSGLHLVFFCSLLMALLQRCSVPRTARFFACCAASIVFGWMVNSAISVWRAALMLLLAQSATLFGRHANTLRSLCLAAFICTVATPYVIGSASFWLSISGVVGVGIFAPWMTGGLRQPRKRILRAPAHTGRNLLELLCVSIAVFPASVLFCGESSLLAPIGNLIILPLCVAALCLGLLTVCTGGLTMFLLPLAGLLCEIAATLAKHMAALPHSHLQITSQAVIDTLLCCTGFVLWITLILRTRRHTALAVLVCAVILSTQLAMEQLRTTQQLRIALLGEPEEMTVVISSNGNTLVADLSNDADNARYAAKYLSDNAIRSVDMLFCGSTTAASYHTALDTVMQVYLTTPSLLRADTTICGCTPVAIAEQETWLTLSDTQICISAGQLRIIWQGHCIAIVPADTEITTAADFIVQYGSISTIEAAYGIQLLTAEETAQNQLLTLSSNGQYTLTALSNTS